MVPTYTEVKRSLITRISLKLLIGGEETPPTTTMICAILEVPEQLLALNLPPKKVVFLIDFHAAVLALRNDNLIDCL
ncbi:hypothetical protein NPIL_162791 [Nephila pilipes]|uniref:Uncharacterized protein n=1 Tax=Nephila pilipes TaxID=299642 RepID=A0A8X6QKZ4_NEPPI|nr:hypothetical protein NPIL_162791 [Nephila pilipes]